MSEQTPLLKEPTGASAPASAPPPPYGAGGQQPPPPVQGQQATTVIIPNQQVVVTGVHFGDLPVSLRCPNCQNDVMSRLEYAPGALTWLIIGVLILLGFWLGCCLIPLCIDGLKDVHHTCPVCNYQLGVHKRL